MNIHVPMWLVWVVGLILAPLALAIGWNVLGLVLHLLGLYRKALLAEDCRPEEAADTAVAAWAVPLAIVGWVLVAPAFEWLYLRIGDNPPGYWRVHLAGAALGLLGIPIASFIQRWRMRAANAATT